MVGHLIIVSLLVQKLVKTDVFGLRNVRYGTEGTRSTTIIFLPPHPPTLTHSHVNNFFAPSPTHPYALHVIFSKGKL